MSKKHKKRVKNHRKKRNQTITGLLSEEKDYGGLGIAGNDEYVEEEEEDEESENTSTDRLIAHLNKKVIAKQETAKLPKIGKEEIGV